MDCLKDIEEESFGARKYIFLNFKRFCKQYIFCVMGKINEEITKYAMKQWNYLHLHFNENLVLPVL